MLTSMHLRAVLDLLARDDDRFVVAVFQDQLLELRRAGDVGALADVDEVALRRDQQRLEAAQARVAGQGVAHAASLQFRHCARRQAGDGRGDRADVRRAWCRSSRRRG